MKRTVVVGILVGAFLLGSAIPVHAWLIYHKPAFKGRVIDAETKEPIEGAVVVAVYEKITAGPAESYESIINVRETLTNKDGEFSIPSYTTVIQPLSWSSRAGFIIFKPGYGSFPDWRIQPPKGMQVDFEEYFSRDLGTEKEVWFQELGKFGAELQRIKVVFGIVELPRLTTKEERLRAVMVGVTGYRSKDLPLLYKAINEEEGLLGLPGKRE